MRCVERSDRARRRVHPADNGPRCVWYRWANIGPDTPHMRKKVRKIVVDDVEYAWAVQERLWPAFVLRVWRGKGDLWFEKEYDVGQPLGLTPQDVAELIRARLALGPA